jgi:Trypsin-co-occurring domain 1
VEVTPVPSEIVRYQVDSDTVAKFEIEPMPGFQPAGPSDVAGKVWDAAGPAVEAAMAVMDRVKRMSPDAVEISFGVKVTGEMDWIVAKAATEGNFQITLSWQPDVSRAGAASGA